MDKSGKTDRVRLLLCLGTGLLALGMVAMPLVFSWIIRWQQWRQEVARQDHTRHWQLKTPEPSAPLQPGLGFFEDIDEVRFNYARSLHDPIQIAVRRSRPTELAEVTLVVRELGNWPKVLQSSQKRISNELFDELRSYVTRQEVIQRSLAAELGQSTDGSSWVLEGRKGGFVLQHVRQSPLDPDHGDAVFAAIGKRFLELAEVKLKPEELY